MPACIGCGYCCWKAPCYEGMKAHPDHLGGPCPSLVWNGSRHLCGLVTQASDEDEADRLKAELAMGEGCCSGLNSWRQEPLESRVP